MRPDNMPRAPEHSEPDIVELLRKGFRCLDGRACTRDHICDEAAAEIERLRTRSAPTNSAEICSKSVVEPTAEHWLTAIVELYGSEADDLTMIEQRARELAQEGE